MQTVFIAVLVVAVSVVLLSVRLLAGKKNFVSSDVDDNAALKEKNISCPMKQDAEQRKHESFAIREH